MTSFDQIRRENSNILPLKVVNFDSQIKVDHFQEFVVFEQNIDLWHTVCMVQTIAKEKKNNCGWISDFCWCMDPDQLSLWKHFGLKYAF